MKSHLCIIILYLLLPVMAAMADDTALLIDKSRSPDGKYELWIVPGHDDGVANGTAQIRRVSDGKIVGTFAWAGFGVRADEHAFKVLWRPDSRFFAISFELTRGYMSCAVYGHSEIGHWREVKLPDDLYISKIKQLSGVYDWKSGKGYQTPKRWLPSGTLELEVCSNDISFEGEDAFKEFEVSLQVGKNIGDPLAVATVTAISEKTEAEVERDLQAK